MKKLVTLLLVLVYGLASIGATVHLHFCCGELEKISLSAAHNKDCPQKEGSFKKCCDSKQVDLKIKADQEPLAKWITTPSDLATSLPSTYYFYSTLLPQAVSTVLSTGPPIQPPTVPLFVRNCVFLI